MKNLIVSLSFVLIGSIANAMGTFNPPVRSLPLNVIGLSSLESAEVVGVQYDAIMCPMVIGTDCVGGMITVVAVKYTLNGCMDELAPVTYEVVKGKDEKYKILLSAHNIHTAESQVTMCIRAPTRTLYVTVNDYVSVENISVESMTTQSEDVLPVKLNNHDQLALAEDATLVGVSYPEIDFGTVIKLSIPYTCGNVLSHVNAKTRTVNNKLIVYVSALEADLATQNCKSLPTEQVSLTVPGIYSASDIEIVNLNKIIEHSQLSF